MLEQHATRGGIVLYGLVDIDIGFLVSLLQEENPSISVKESRVCRLFFYRFVAHLLCFLKVVLRQTKIVGIIIQCCKVLWSQVQTAVVSLESFFIKTFLVKNIAHNGVKIRNDIGVAVWFYLCHALLESLQCCIVFFLHILRKTLKIIENHLFRIVFLGRARNGNYFIVLLFLPNVLYESYASTRIIGFYGDGLFVNLVHTVHWCIL